MSRLRVLVGTGTVGISVALIAAGCSTATPPPPLPTLPATTTTVAPTTTITDSEPGLATETDAIRLAAGDDFQAIVDEAPDAATFIIEPGVHRLQEIYPRDGMTFEGLPGSVLSGAIELEGWNRSEPAVWRYDGISPTVMEHGACIEGYAGCRLSQDLYMDDVMLWQVTARSELGSGKWYWDGDIILVADDPTARHVELSIVVHAFVGDVARVTIRGVVIEKYAVPAQFGAIQSEARGGGTHGVGWLIEDVEVRLNHGAGIRMGDDTIVRNSFIHDNGQLGIAASGGHGATVEDSEIANNNLAGFDSGWEGGGAKFKETVDLVVRRNLVHDNEGPGLWTDINNRNTLYESNVVVDNSGPGIFHEISFSAVIRDNRVTGNGFGWDTWSWGSGILIAASESVEVVGNVVTGNADGISGIQQTRERDSGGKYLLSDLYVHDNTISAPDGHTGIVEDNGDEGVFTERGNRFEANTYLDMEGRRYVWEGRKLDAAGWMRAGQDLDGTWLP